MFVHIYAIGRLKSGGEAELVRRYRERSNRLARPCGLRGINVRALRESRAPDASARKTDESDRLLDALPAGATIVALDERGRSLASDAFADFLGAERDRGCHDLVFIIGGADGLHERVLRRAAHLLSFGRQTWPHQLVQAMLLEQMYRALTIWQGHPYHR